jgi:hypothetical protein
MYNRRESPDRIEFSLEFRFVGALTIGIAILIFGLGMIQADLSSIFAAVVVALFGVLFGIRKHVAFDLSVGVVESSWSVLWFRFKSAYPAVQVAEIRVSGSYFRGEPYFSLSAVLENGKHLSVAYDLSAMNLTIEDAERISKRLNSKLVIGSSYYDVKRSVMGASAKSAQLALLAAIGGAVFIVIGILIASGAIPIAKGDLTEKAILDKVRHRQFVGLIAVYGGGLFGILSLDSWSRYKRRPKL